MTEHEHNLLQESLKRKIQALSNLEANRLEKKQIDEELACVNKRIARLSPLLLLWWLNEKDKVASR